MSAPTTLSEKFTDFLHGAIYASLWSSTVMGDEEQETRPAVDYYMTDGEDKKLRGTLAYYARDWFLENFGFLSLAIEKQPALDWIELGRDWWLTIEGHGAGYWDRGLEEVGEKLTHECQGYSDIVSFYVDPDDKDYLLVDTYNVTEFNDNLVI